MDYVLSLLGPWRKARKSPLTLFFITLALAVPLGLALALARISRWRALSQLVNGYIWLMRGTPLMLQMLFIYFALPFVPVIGVRLPDFPAAVVAFALNYAAYFAEIFRAGIQSVDRGQYEGSKVLGMSLSADHAPHRAAADGAARAAAHEQRDHHAGHDTLIYVGPERHPAHGAGHCAAGLHHHALPGGRRLLPDHDAGVDVVLPASGKALCQSTTSNPMDRPVAIQADGIVKSFGANRVLDGVSLTLSGRGGGGDRAVRLGQEHLPALPEPPGDHRRGQHRRGGRVPGPGCRRRP